MRRRKSKNLLLVTVGKLCEELCRAAGGMKVLMCIFDGRNALTLGNGHSTSVKLLFCQPRLFL